MKRSLGVQWQPIPSNLCAELCKLDFDRSSPAPRAVVYAWLWHMLHNEAEVSIREVASYAGWSRWKAEQIRKQTINDIATWKAKPDDSSHPARQNQTKTRQATPVILDSCGPRPDTLPDKTRQRPDDHARSLDHTYKESTITKQEKAPSLEWKKAWEEIKAIYGAKVPGAKPNALVLGESRKKALKARISEFGEEDVVKVTRWIYTSHHNRATFVREKGTLDTILRASKFPQYLELMKQEQNTPVKAPQSFSKPVVSPKPTLGWSEAQRAKEMERAAEELKDMRMILTEDQFKKACEVEAQRNFEGRTTF